MTHVDFLGPDGGNLFDASDLILDVTPPEPQAYAAWGHAAGLNDAVLSWIQKTV